MNTPQSRAINSTKVFLRHESDGMTPIWVTRYDLTIYNLGGNADQNVSGTALFYDNAIALLKLSGMNMKNARIFLNDADIRRELNERASS